MSWSVRISGASDDLIEVEGAISEEFTATSGHVMVVVSTGDLIRFRFEREGWRANVVHDQSGVLVEMVDGGSRVEIGPSGSVRWVLVVDDEDAQWAQVTG